ERTMAGRAGNRMCSPGHRATCARVLVPSGWLSRRLLVCGETAGGASSRGFRPLLLRRQKPREPKGGVPRRGVSGRRDNLPGWADTYENERESTAIREPGPP